MGQLNLTEEWYRNALEIEADVEISAGPPIFSFYDREIETKADQILAAAASAGVSLEEMRPVALELLRRMKKRKTG